MTFQRIHEVVNTPLKRRGVFDKALAALGPADLPKLLEIRDQRLLRGDWRRAAVARRIEQLQGERRAPCIRE